MKQVRNSNKVGVIILLYFVETFIIFIVRQRNEIGGIAVPDYVLQIARMAAFFGTILAIIIYLKIRKRNRIIREKRANEAIDYAKQSADYSLYYSDDMEQDSNIDVDLDILDEYRKEYREDYDLKDEHDYERYMSKHTGSQVFDKKVILKWICRFFEVVIILGLIVAYPYLGAFVVMALIYVSENKKRKKPKEDSAVYSRLFDENIHAIIGGDCSYVQDLSIDKDEIYKLNCFEDAQNIVESSGLLEGTYKGVHFQCSNEEIIYEYEETDSDGDKCTRRRELFKGIMVCIPYKKYSPYSVGLHSNSWKSIVNSTYAYGKYDSGTLETESVAFNMLYSVHSDNDENMFYILTPDIMEKLAGMYKWSHNENSGYNGLCACFKNGNLYLGLRTGYRYFTYKRAIPTEDALRKVNREMQMQLKTMAKLLDYAYRL